VAATRERSHRKDVARALRMNALKGGSVLGCERYGFELKTEHAGLALRE